tara:strand:- start:20 stop:163 length:144 start_codon:yes stop_codon:yes gene_type:complete
MKFSLFIFVFFLLSCGSMNTPADPKNNKKDNNIKMKVTGEPNIKMKK